MIARSQTAALIALLMIPMCAAAAPPLVDPPASERKAGMVWAPQAVRVAAPDAVRPAPPHVPDGAPMEMGEVRVGPDRAASFWVERLGVLRIRPDADVQLRAARVVGGPGARAVIDESDALMVLEGRTRLLVQGPAGSAVWHLTSAEPVTVRIERLARRPARVIWETARRDLLDLAADPSTDNALPALAGATTMERQLGFATALADRVGAAPGSPVAAAVRRWREAVAVDLWAAEAPFDSDPRSVTDPLEHLDPTPLDLPDGTSSALSQWVAMADGDRQAMRFDGGGAIRVEARALEPGRAAPVVTLRHDDGRALMRLEPRSIPASVDHGRWEGFPDRRPLMTTDGRPVGPRITQVWSMARPQASMVLSVEGGPALVRLTRARVRPMLDEWRAGPTTMAARLAAASDGLDGDSPAHRKARLLVDGVLDPRSACDAVDPEDPALAAWAATRCFAARPDAEHFAALPPLLDAAEQADAVLGWQLRLDAARVADAAGQENAAGLLPLGPLPNSLPPRLVAEVDARRPRPPVDPAGARFARAEDLWRRRPGDRDARSLVIESWSHTRWLGLRPTTPADGVPPTARRWLTVGLPLRPDDDDLIRLTPIRPGQTAEIVLPPVPPEVGRSRRLTVIAERPEGKPFELTLGERRWRVEPGAPTESVAFAAPPGTYTLAVHGPESLVAWVDGELDEPLEEQGRLEWAWTATDTRGRALRVDVPMSVERRRMKLVVRGVGIEKTHLDVRTDIGPAQRIDLDFGGPDPNARSLDDQPAPSTAVDVVIDLPPTTGSIELVSPDGERLLIRPTLRSPDLVPPSLSTVEPEPKPATGVDRAPAPVADPFDVIEKTSRVLAHRPEEWSARVRRAGALLDLDLTVQARPDLEALRYDAPPSLAMTIDGLLARYSAIRDPDVLSVATTGPVPLDPLVVPARVDPRAPQAWLAREGRALRARGDDLAAARSHLNLYRDSATLAAARAAQIDLRSVLLGADPAPAGIASLAFGSTVRIEDDGFRSGVTGLRAPAAANSRWLTLESVENAAGYEVLRLPAISRFVPPALRVRTALLAAPWDAADGHTLRPGTGASVALRLTRPATFAAEVWCVPDPEDRPCRVRVQKGAGESERFAAPPGRKTVIPLGDQRGRVNLDVLLEKNGPAAASVRFVVDRALNGETTPSTGGMQVLRPYRERRVFRTLDRRPVEIAVAGPGALRLEAWRPSSSSANAVKLGLIGPDGKRRDILVPLDQTTGFARGEGRRPLVVGRTSRRIVPLLAEGTYRVIAAPDRGEALMRLSIRVDRDGKNVRVPPPMAWKLAPFDPLGGLPAALVPPTAAEADADWSAGSLSLQLSWLQAVEDEDDSASVRPPQIVELAAIGRRYWARQKVHGRLGPAVRASLEGDLVVGGRGMLRAAGLGPRIGLELAANGWTQPGSDRWSAGGRLTGWRSWALSPDWLLTPSLRLWGTRSADRPTDGTTIDPVLSTEWRRDHPFGWRLGASTRWQALRAQHLRGGLHLFSNDDFASPDRLDLSMSWTALFGLGTASTLEGRLGYRPSLRFADDDRDEAGLAHAPWASVRAGFWIERDTRLVLGGRFTPYIGLDGDISPRFSLTIGLDFTGGRRLVDFTPLEEPYPDLAGRRFWLSPVTDNPGGH